MNLETNALDNLIDAIAPDISSVSGKAALSEIRKVISRHHLDRSLRELNIAPLLSNVFFIDCVAQVLLGKLYSDYGSIKPNGTSPDDAIGSLIARDAVVNGRLNPVEAEKFLPGALDAVSVVDMDADANCYLLADATSSARLHEYSCDSPPGSIRHVISHCVANVRDAIEKTLTLYLTPATPESLEVMAEDDLVIFLKLAAIKQIYFQ